MTCRHCTQEDPPCWVCEPSVCWICDEPPAMTDVLGMLWCAGCWEEFDRMALSDALAWRDRPRTTPEGSEAAYDPLEAAESAPLRWVDLFGIDPDYTGGVPVDEWLEKNRGEA